MPYRILADVLVLLHLAFVLFVVAGGFLALRRPRILWLHAPAAIWGVLIELQGWICPLTPLENRLRRLGGQAGYEGGFTEHYVVPLLYPAELDRSLQVWLGILVAGLNLCVYAWIIARHRRRRSTKETP